MKTVNYYLDFEAFRKKQQLVRLFYIKRYFFLNFICNFK